MYREANENQAGRKAVSQGVRGRISRHLGRGFFFWHLLLVGAAALLLAGCPHDEERHLAAVGDSLTAGHQNGCTYEGYQPNGYAPLVARQLDRKMTLPLIGWPGMRPCLTITETGNPFTIARVTDDGADVEESATWGARTNPEQEPDNWAVPGTRVVDAVDGPDLSFFGLIPTYDYAYFHEQILVDPETTMIEAAAAQDPKFTIMWLGANDALWAALLGTDALLTPTADFQTAFEAALDALLATGTDLVAGNVPDATVIPHLIPPEVIVAWTGGAVDLPTLCALGVCAGDYLTMNTGLPHLGEIMAGAPGPTPSRNWCFPRPTATPSSWRSCAKPWKTRGW